ncbi:MAG: MotA/TolQ/ExbB proton channel family protein [Planctomycetes bacterium]|nr:MotA/TolQ/ExbB proton channel family protein [Planctomycetota bacterium]
MLRIIFLVVILTVIVFMIFGFPAFAQPTDGVSSPDSAIVEIKYFDFFVVKGGPIAFGLIGLSIVTIALAIEHAVSIRRVTMVPPHAAEMTKSLIEKKKYLEAIQFTADEPSMIGYVLNAGLVEASNGYIAMERALEDSLEERSAQLYRKIEYVHIIGNVSPMIGLLGTVTGMIFLFAEIHAADAFPGARIVADRIAVALITTFWGLAVAIPALSIFAIFRNRIDVLTAECALATEHILAVFKPTTGKESSARSSGEARSE